MNQTIHMAKGTLELDGRVMQVTDLTVEMIYPSPEYVALGCELENVCCKPAAKFKIKCKRLESLAENFTKSYLGMDLAKEKTKETMEKQQIEGVPAGYRAVGYRVPRRNEIYLNNYGEVRTADSEWGQAKLLVLVHDNVYGKLLKDVKIPEGYEVKGRSKAEYFRVPDVGERFVNRNSLTSDVRTSLDVNAALAGPDFRRLIVGKVAPKTKKVLVVEVPYNDVSPIYSGHAAAMYVYHSLIQDISFRVEERPI